MKVLLFHAATTAIAAVAMTNVANKLREEGHSVGERFLPAFKVEKEPADRLLVCLTPVQADQYKDRGVELVAAFRVSKDNDILLRVSLPDTDEELADWDVSEATDMVDGPTAGVMDIDQAKAEAIERGLEVTPETTKLDLEHMLGLSISESVQAGDRRSDAVNNQNTGEPRIGVRTSRIMPSTNGVDLERLNDEQLRAAAAEIGLTVSPTMKNSTIINKMTAMYAKRLKAPEDSAPKSPTAATDPGSKELPSSEHDLPSLDGMDVDQLKAQAVLEGVDIGNKTAVNSIRSAIEDKRKSVKEHSDNG
jgi:hypothetical protein